MATEFRCEKCGKLLRVDAEPGGAVRCPHCRKKVTMPAALASLPRPQVPPNAQAPAAGDGDEDQEQELIAHGPPDPVMAVMAALMPWVLSVLFHLGLALIMLFVVMIVHKTVPDVDPPGSVAPDEVLTMDITSTDSPRAKAKDPLKEKTYRRKKTAEQESGKTNKRAIIGLGAASGLGENPFGGRSTGSSFYGTPGGGGGGGGRGAYHIVFVIDRSGSMTSNMDEVRLQMQLSVSRLRPVQDFHVILFAEDKAMENPPRRLVSATPENKIGLVQFLEGVRAAGQTTALPALKRAFAVLKRADPRRKGKLIYLLTDGVFAGLGGGSRYKGLSGNQAVVQWLRDNNTDGQVHINTYLYGRDEEAIKVMTSIAKENGGVFTPIGDE